MAISLSIPSIGFSGLTSSFPNAFPVSASGTSSAVFSIPASGPDQVALSTEGQLLSALSAFRSDLERVQTGASDPSPDVVSVAAQRFVDAFNGLQSSVGSLQADQFPLAVNALFTTSIAPGSSVLGSLQRIGIELPAASLSDSAATGSSLRIDQRALNAAVAADATGAQALLAGASQLLTDLTTRLELQVADLGTSAAAAASLSGSRVTLDALSEARQGVGSRLSQVVGATTQTSGTTTGIRDIAATGDVPDATAQAPSANSATPGEQLAAATAALAASIALQHLLNDPAVRVRNNLLDPAYTALVAASRLNDFVLRDPQVDPQALAIDFPPPVSSAALAHGIAYYKEAAEDPRKYLANHVNSRV